MLVINTVYNYIERNTVRVRLTKRHMAVVQFLIRHRNKLVTKGAIMDHVYGLEIDEEPHMKIIDVFLCHIRRKLDEIDIRIKTIWGRGLIFEWDDNEQISVEGYPVVDGVDA